MMTMVVATLACLCFVFSSVYAQLTTLASCKEEVCCNKQATPYLTSCKDIKQKWSNSPSGYYQLGTRRGPVSTYCNMNGLCGSKGGWTRIGYLNMGNPNENCPSGFRLYQNGGIKTCGRATSSAGSCTSVKFLADDISYSQVCGRVVGYQHGSPDAVIEGAHHNDINSYYVDGVSITCGFPRQHVWTLIAGLLEAAMYFENTNHLAPNCPCSTGSPQKSTLQSFIGSDYFCESGNPSTDGKYPYNVLYTSDPLWDGKGCGSLEGTCCAAPGLPWFHKTLDNATTDYIELRVCGDEGTENEDTPIVFYEIYIK